jgi:hypothetical protein
MTNSARKRMAADLWQAYFKNPLEDIQNPKILSKNQKSVASTKITNKSIDENIKKLKEGFLRLPNMLKKYKLKREAI